MRIGLEVGFVATVVAVLVGIVVLVAVAARRAGREPRRDATRVAATIVAWLGITAGLATVAPPPLLAIALAVAGLVMLRTPAGRSFVSHAPRTTVVALQTFRVAVELVLWGLFLADDLPRRMTFEGRNLDVLVGLTALPLAFLAWGGARRRAGLAIVWHVAGLLLLANIVSMAIRAQPAVISTIPFIWLPAFLVPVALLGHAVGLQQSRVRGAVGASVTPPG
jgi:hypothetical protein